jgi:hypothetical protein
VNRICVRWAAVALGTAFVTVASSCVGVAGDVGYGGDVGVGVDYYDPGPVIYGGWGPGYHVGPWRGGDRPRVDAGRPAPHYRAAPAGRAMPSIPSRGRGRR